ncbi:hypothetical protein GCM10009687_26380 [Asanoa iriomotensis]|uniref:Uncharacterized protein n=1 Tax=Asanoa iriomotensis TaxID=234613 RepID=A0ABQ4CE98_9ACTN|nr:hypothetical protein Air01nite_71910 [Asanoa iriomotensis]
MTPAKALELWPKLPAAGMRLGSPSNPINSVGLFNKADKLVESPADPAAAAPAPAVGGVRCGRQVRRPGSPTPPNGAPHAMHAGK